MRTSGMTRSRSLGLMVACFVACGGGDTGAVDSAVPDTARDLAMDPDFTDPGPGDLDVVDPGSPDPGFTDPGSVWDDSSTSGDGDTSDAPVEGDGDPDAPEWGDLSTGDDSPDPPASFLVLTINLKNPLLGQADAEKRLQIVADTIVDRQPDVVALQEVTREEEGQPSFAEKLAGMTGYEWVWEYTFTVPFLFEEGLGILSRWPVVWSGSQFLPHTDLVLFQRKVLGTRLATPHGDMQFFCSHMTTDSNETVKADQALAVYQFIGTHPSPLPGFLAGDLNAKPDTLAMRFLRGEAEYQGVTGDLSDAWLTVHPDEDGFTMESNNPTKRIDYIYQVPGKESTAEATSCEIVFDKTVGGLYASDHLGVLCGFSLK